MLGTDSTRRSRSVQPGMGSTDPEGQACLAVLSQLHAKGLSGNNSLSQWWPLPGQERVVPLPVDGVGLVVEDFMSVSLMRIPAR
jgi:hypothetical protein